MSELGVPQRGTLEDLVYPTRYPVAEDGRFSVYVKPYQVIWLKI